MPRRPTYIPLNVLLNNQLVGQLHKEPSGAVQFRYDESWLDRINALPVSLSLPLREDAYRGAPVLAVFENLLPDSIALRRKVAERVGAAGTDAYSMLAEIGRDCVGALQFVADGNDIPVTRVGEIDGEAQDESQIEDLLNNLARAPLGLGQDTDFRISVAGAQEKTALLRHEGKWLKPHGTTPTTHIFKTQIGELANGIDLNNSVENEYYCLKLCELFDLPVNVARIETFGTTKALVIERFDRRWTKDGRLLRLPQEDCCQALSMPPTRKYQSEGGPGMEDVLNLLKGSDDPALDQQTFLMAQILFWILGATDGHAKNFSLFITPGGGFDLTPLYDILTAQPSLANNQIRRKQMTLAMSVGSNRHYRIEEIHPRHFFQTAEAAGVAKSIVRAAFVHIVEYGHSAFDDIERHLPADFPSEIHETVRKAALLRLRSVEAFIEAGE